MRQLTSLITLLIVALSAVATEPQRQTPDCGTIDRLRLYSPQMADTMTIDVWTPDSYSTANRYPVIYMHDGQNLFDATTTWNHQAWEMDTVMCRLIHDGQVSPAIIVGIHSTAETRVADLMPQKAVATLPIEARGDAYASFLANTLKPLIDTTYSTLPDARHTSLMGSSMGGLMSIYALCEYPSVFGNAACLSTHWIGLPTLAKEFEDAMYGYIDAHLPSATDHRLYFDHGTATLDANYGPAEQRMLQLVKAKGYNYTDGSLLNIVDHGAAHDERSWAARVAIPLRFLLTPTRP